MIRQLTAADTQITLDFANTSPAIHTFLIGDIENYGIENEDMTLWGQFEGDALVGVLLRYFKFFMVYYLSDDADIVPFVETLKNYDGEILSISGKNTVIEKFMPYFACLKVEKTQFCELKSSVEAVEDEAVRFAGPDDVDQLFDLLSGIEEFSPPLKETLTKTLETGSGRIYMLTDETGKVISIAQTTAENSASAMIIGVCTKAEHRKKGYMRRVMTRLCVDLQSEGKALSLFYSNKDAGKIYHSLGFETTGEWTMMKFA